jgi:hypothetical protein
MSRFYSYDPSEGISFHETEDDARGEAEATLEQMEDDAADYGWEDLNPDDVCWGEVLGGAEQTSSRPATEEEQKKGFDSIVTYAVRDCEVDDKARVERVAQKLFVMERDVDSKWDNATESVRDLFRTDARVILAVADGREP